MLPIQLVTLVIPIHNEEKILLENVRAMMVKLHEKMLLPWEILLVENGSLDQTWALAQQLKQENPGRVNCIHLAQANYGLAMKNGLLQAQGDILINFDIDYWDVDFVVMASHVMQIRYEIVIASKNLLLSKDRRGWLRKVASYVFRMILFFCFGLRVTDTHGIKAWRNSPRMKNYFAQSAPSHHTYDTEVIIRAMRDHCEVLEIPVEVVETRESDRHILKRVPKALWELTQLFFKSKS